MHHTRIDSHKKGLIASIKDIVTYKDLFFILAYRDIKIRYAQTFLGIAWAIIQPLLTISIFTFLFTRAFNMEVPVPYALYATAGMSTWSYFSYVLGQSGSSLIASQDIVKKVYFPRLIIPLSKAIAGLIDYTIIWVAIIGLLIYYQMWPGSNFMYLPIFILFTLLTSLGMGIWISSLTIRYRDFQYIIPFIIQLGLYVSPVAYPASKIPAKFTFFYFLNPVAGIIEGVRWSLFLNTPFDDYILISLAIGLILFFTSILYFVSVEEKIADII